MPLDLVIVGPASAALELATGLALHLKNRNGKHQMGTVISDMSMSLDGYIAGPKDDDKPDRELEALERLHDWMFPPKGNFQEIEGERFKNVGAVLMGRRMFNLGEEPWGDDPPFHMPVFVLTHNARDPLVKKGGLPTSLSPMESRV